MMFHVRYIGRKEVKLYINITGTYDTNRILKTYNLPYYSTNGTQPLVTCIGPEHQCSLGITY